MPITLTNPRTGESRTFRSQADANAFLEQTRTPQGEGEFTPSPWIVPQGPVESGTENQTGAVARTPSYMQYGYNDNLGLWRTQDNIQSGGRQGYMFGPNHSNTSDKNVYLYQIGANGKPQIAQNESGPIVIGSMDGRSLKLNDQYAGLGYEYNADLDNAYVNKPAVEYDPFAESEVSQKTPASTDGTNVNSSSVTYAAAPAQGMESQNKGKYSDFSPILDYMRTSANTAAADAAYAQSAEGYQKSVGQSQAAAQQAIKSQQAAMNAQMAAQGIDPSSAQGMALRSQMGLEGAKIMAGTTNTAIDQQRAAALAKGQAAAQQYGQLGQMQQGAWGLENQERQIANQYALGMGELGAKMALGNADIKSRQDIARIQANSALQDQKVRWATSRNQFGLDSERERNRHAESVYNAGLQTAELEDKLGGKTYITGGQNYASSAMRGAGLGYQMWKDNNGSSGGSSGGGTGGWDGTSVYSDPGFS